MDPSLHNGRTCSLLKSQLSTVHHGAKHSQTSRPYILTAATDLGLLSSELQHCMNTQPLQSLSARGGHYYTRCTDTRDRRF